MAAVNTVPEVDTPVAADARWALVNRIASSQHLKSSPRLCEFLFYVAKCAIREAPEDATEQQIGIRVFGRPPGYNSSEDSIVRTHARLQERVQQGAAWGFKGLSGKFGTATE